MFVETPRVSFTGGSQTLTNDTEFHAQARRFSGSVSHYQTDKRSVHQKNTGVCYEGYEGYEYVIAATPPQQNRYHGVQRFVRRSSQDIVTR